MWHRFGKAGAGAGAGTSAFSSSGFECLPNLFVAIVLGVLDFGSCASDYCAWGFGSCASNAGVSSSGYASPDLEPLWWFGVRVLWSS